MTLFPEWFQPFENIDFNSVKVELQQIWSGFGGDKNSENMLVFKLNSNELWNFLLLPSKHTHTSFHQIVLTQASLYKSGKL